MSEGTSRLIVFVAAALLGSACGSPAEAPDPVARAPAEIMLSVVGEWCLVSTAQPSRAAPAGALWRFHADGRFDIDDGFRRSGTFVVEGTSLRLERVGVFSVAVTAPDALTLTRSDTQYHLARGCAPAVEAARLTRELVTAAGAGAEDGVRALLDRGAPPDAVRHEPDTTALIEAARAGHTRVVELLLARGANPLLEAGAMTARDAAEAGHHTLAARALAAAEPRAPIVLALRVRGRDGRCATQFQEVDGVCVHPLAVSRESLADDIAAYRTGAEPPHVTRRYEPASAEQQAREQRDTPRPEPPRPRRISRQTMYVPPPINSNSRFRWRPESQRAARQLREYEQRNRELRRAQCQALRSRAGGSISPARQRSLRSLGISDAEYRSRLRAQAERACRE